MIKFILHLSICLFTPSFNYGFSLLSHEAIIDATWESSIKPLLKDKYPSASPDDINQAHAYVYGGSLMPDIGYYPFGSLLFTHLLHYVRTGDFIQACLDSAENINEYAFGLGLLCHYNADKYGHSLGTNVALAILFPKEQKKYGDTIPYELARTEHMKTEFGFDVLQTAKGNYAPEAQHDFIGFKVSEGVLAKAFLKTYGIQLKDLFKSLPIAIETFRFTVKQMFPELTRAAWKVRKSVITKLNPLAEQASYTKKTDRKSYNKEFGKPQIKSSLLAFVMGILPKVGPLAGLKFKEPTDEAEKIFDKSFKAILIHYSASINNLKEDKVALANVNLDTGKKIARNEYRLVDKSYFQLLKVHERKKFKNMSPGLKKSLLDFYANNPAKADTSHKEYKPGKIIKSVDNLQKAGIKD